MKKQIAFILTFIMGLSIFVACNNDDNNGAANPIIGTWKLVEAYSNSSQVALSSCAMEESFIFGPEQFTHELYGNGSGRLINTSYRGVSDSHDDDDDESDDDDDDHHSDDESDDNSDDTVGDDTTNDDTTTDDSTDDGTDDNGGNGGSGNCVNTERVIGSWTSSNNIYSLTANDATEVMPVTFIDANNRFYVEVTSTVNGNTVVKRYVYQKQ